MIVRVKAETELQPLKELGYFTCEHDGAVIGMTYTDVVYAKDGETLVGTIEDFDKGGYPIREWLNKASKTVWKPNIDRPFNSMIPHIDCRVCGKLMINPKDKCYCFDCMEIGRKQDKEKIMNADNASIERLSIAIIKQACVDFKSKSKRMEIERFMTSKWFNAITMGLDGEYMLNLMSERV